MQVGPVTSTLVTPVERGQMLDPVATKTAPPPLPKAPSEPAPALRPTIQDTIDVDRTLMALLGGQ